MRKTIVHHEGAAALAAAGLQRKQNRAVIKLGVDVHSTIYVVVAQYDHATPRAPRRFAPSEFLPWVGGLLQEGHEVHVVYEACGFGFGLCRSLRAAGASCHVITPQKLDEQRTGVKTDARDAATLCQRLSRDVDGNTRELATIRVPTEEAEQRRHIHRQREALVRHRTKLQAQGRGLLVNHGQAAPPHLLARPASSLVPSASSVAHPDLDAAGPAPPGLADHQTRSAAPGLERAR